VLVERSPALGIGFEPRDEEEDSPPATADVRAWLEEQLKLPDDTIGDPPADFRRLLEDRRDALDAIVGALETAPPEWKEASSEDYPAPDLRPSVRLHRVLLAAALVATRRGDPIEAERFVEASWSLAKPNEGSRRLIRQLIAIAAGRWQAGVLRKLQSVPPIWISRLSEMRSWEASLAAWEHEMRPRKSDDSSLAPGSLEDETLRKGFEAVLSGLRKLGPCEGSNLDDNGVWKMVERELPMTSDEVVAQNRKILFDILLPNMKNAFNRAGLLDVDRELTLEILRLRQAKEQDSEKRWPGRMANATSTICPAFSYVYRSDDEGMEIRFDGTLVDPVMQFVLPVTFRSANPKPEPPPAEAPVLTPTPAGGMISPQ